MSRAKFATVINCMDGRTQLPVIEWMLANCGVDYVDNVTEPAPVKILAEAGDSSPAKAIMGRVAISVEKHCSDKVAVVAHYDCAGNPESESVQMRQLRSAVNTVKSWGFPVEVIGLWVDENWQVRRVL